MRTLLSRLSSKECGGGNDELDEHGLAPIHYVTQLGDINKLKDLVASGCSVDIVSSELNGFTPPLVYAATNGHVDCVRLLLSAGAHVEAGDGWGNTALYKACCYDHSDCVGALLEAGADPSVANKCGSLPLQIAALQGYTRTLKLLLKHGAKLAVDERGLYGDVTLPPPLVSAATRGQLDCLRLLAHDAHSLHPAQLNASLTMALYYFLCACAGYQHATAHASLQQRTECVQLLVDIGAPVTIEHLKVVCCHLHIPLTNLKPYVSMLKTLLQASNFDASHQPSNDAMMVLFGHVTRLGHYKWELLELICSVGFTPSEHLLEGLAFTLSEHELRELERLRQSPRRLTDLCALTMRSHVNTNVQHAVRHMELPQLIRNMILVNSC